MDSLIQQFSTPLNGFNLYNHHSQPTTLIPNHVQGYDSSIQFNQLSDSSPASSDDSSPKSSSLGSESDVSQKPDFYEGVLGFLTQMLMEEDDLHTKPCMLHECLALQAAERSFYDVLVDKKPLPDHSNSYSFGSSNDRQFSSLSDVDKDASTCSLTSLPVSLYAEEVKGEENSVSLPGKKRNPSREESNGGLDEPSTKLMASFTEGPDESDLMYDRVLLCPDINPNLQTEALKASKKKRSPGGKSRSKRNVDTGKEIVDLTSLLTQCGQALSNGDSNSAHELIKKIKQHSSPNGHSTQRLAHYFIEAIEARLAGTGTDIYRAFSTKRISAAETLESYHMYMKAIPFHKMSNIIANKTIKGMSAGKGKIHIIHFGILYGFQWPCFIQNLSLTEGGAPKLRITGIDFPQPGFRPTERIEETGRRLAKYCKRFNVPFEYNAIAKKWETIKIEELKIESDEFVVVNCLYRLQNVPEETVEESSPRDKVLNLIKKVNPDMFVHGIMNGTYNAPFFLTRFREALFHFSALFDMFEASVPREDKNRLMYEQQLYGRDVMNVIACEGTSRVERPETYKQSQVRNIRAGFRQMPLSRDIVNEVRGKVKLSYHKDFLVDEDSNWILQGWKGRVLYALSIWKPVS